MKKVKFGEIFIVFLISLLVLFGAIYSQNINNVDDMWTFSFSSKLANGYMVYRDYNMVQTPLYAQITAVFLKLFGNTMFVSCIVGSIECAVIVLIQYLTLRKLNVDKKASALITTFLMLFLIKIATNSYNLVALLFAYIVLYIEIVKLRYNKYVTITNKEKFVNIFKIKISYDSIYNILTGICIGLTFLSKQTIGVYLVLVITLYYFSQVFILKEKSFKRAFIELSEKAVACILVVLAEVLWLYLNGALYQFIDYTFGGIGKFGAKNRANIFKNLVNTKEVSNFIIVTLFGASILILPVILYMNKKGYIKAKNKLDNNILILTILYIIIGFGYSYPLANTYHVGITKQVVIYMAILNIISFKGIRNIFGRQMSKLAYILLISVLVLYGELNIIADIITNKGVMHPFEHMNISEGAQGEILEIKKYVQNYEKENNIPVYIIDSFAAKYNLAMERNGGIFDLALYGNLGKQDYNLVIDKLENMSNYAVIMLNNDEDIFWQQPKEIKEWIQKNLKKVDSVEKINFLLEENKDREEYIYDVYIKE